MNVEELIDKAKFDWKIDNLCADLELAKSGELTNNEYNSLCGLLCRYQPAAIAKILCKDAAGLRVELTRGLYRYIEILILNKTNQEFQIRWSEIPIQLGKLGYKKTLPTPPTSSETKVQWRMWIDISDIEQIQLENIVKVLKQLIGNSSLRLDKIEPGSILLFFESTQAGYERIEALFRDEQLTELLGVPVLDVRLTSDIASVNPSIVVKLTQWVAGNFVEAIAAGWEIVENILGPRQLAFMNPGVIKRGRLIHIGDTCTVALVVEISDAREERVDVRILVYPVEENNNYLPENLKLTLTIGEEFQEIQTESNTNYLLQEITELVAGEQFNVRLSWEHDSVTIDFSI